MIWGMEDFTNRGIISNYRWENIRYKDAYTNYVKSFTHTWDHKGREGNTTYIKMLISAYL